MIGRNRELIALTPLLLLAACAAPQPRLLPICNIKCSVDEQCTIEHSVSVADMENIFRKLRASFPYHGIDIVSVTSGYAIVLAADAADQRLRDSWQAVGCFTATIPPTNADYARLEQCVSGMTKWIDYRKPSDAPALVLDASFRRTCLNSTERLTDPRTR